MKLIHISKKLKKALHALPREVLISTTINLFLIQMMSFLVLKHIQIFHS